jgi:di/tricarboxylate transporter
VRTGKSTLLLDVSAELVTEAGNKIHDVGVVHIPVEVDSHLYTKILMLVVIALVVFLFIVEWFRIDVVAIIVMIALPELGLLNAGDAFKGLSSNAVIAIIGVMIISYGLNRAGLVGKIVNPLIKHVTSGATRFVVVFSSLIAVISSVMQNTGAAVLFLPAIKLISGRELKIHVSRVLMPIGMAAILGGTLTMIGTSPLILLNDILPEGMAKFSFLELTPIGLAIVVGGIAYLSTIGMKVLSKLPVAQSANDLSKDNDTQKNPISNYSRIGGPLEIFVPVSYTPTDNLQNIAEIRRQYLVNIVAVKTEDDQLVIAPSPNFIFKGGMSLCVYGQLKEIEQFVGNFDLVLFDKPQRFKKDLLFNPSYAGIVEMVISPRSGFIGKTIKDIRFRETYSVNAMALHQKETVYYKQLADRPLSSGDCVLIHGTWEQIQSLKKDHQNFIIISSDIEFHRPHKSRAALFSFLLALTAMLISSFYFQKMPYNPLPLSLCLMFGALLMILTKVISISEAYQAVDWRTVFLLGGLIPLGAAVDQTGTAQWIAEGIVLGLGDLLSPLVLLIVLAVISGLFTLVISNVGACALLVPLGVSIANQIGIDPRVAAIVVGIGVSNSFLLPTHQVNALYMVPGEYRTKDYLIIGGGLSIVYITILVTVTYLFYL